ncbi:hypothetical protein AN958_06364 [Leucoagaricus sp. SymC.cos]|nr:hypothetical protein AN958_06364 [Leucoagaricus sp. SymC.cos]
MSTQANLSSSSPQPWGISMRVASASSNSLTPSSSSVSLSSSLSSGAKSKPPNVFSNDGTFLERFQRNKMEEQEKKKVETELERSYTTISLSLFVFSGTAHSTFSFRKINFEDRFKNRAKHRLPSPEDEDNEPVVIPSLGASNSSSGPSIPQDDRPAKKTKAEGPINKYQQELRKYGRSKGDLSDSGTGVRPLVK